jgi:D-aminopeptidase
MSPAHLTATYVNDEVFDPVYEAAVQVVEEAVVNAMVAADDMTTLKPAGKVVRALPHKSLVEVMQRYGRVACL